MNQEQIRGNLKTCCNGLNISPEFLQVISGIVWDTTLSADERVFRIQILLHEASANELNKRNDINNVSATTDPEITSIMNLPNGFEFIRKIATSPRKYQHATLAFSKKTKDSNGNGAKITNERFHI